VVGAPPGEHYAFPCVPAGFEPDAALSDAPLPDVLAENVRCMTSGGSTGRPKLIVDLSPALVDPDAPDNGMLPGGVTLVPGPLYHAGPFMTSWSQLLGGGTVVLMSRFDAEQALALIERHRVDWVLFVPTMMQRIWRLPEPVRRRYDVSSLRRVMSTGAPSPAWLKRAWIDWLGPEKIFEAYGGTERSGGTMISGVEWLAHPGSVGRPTLGRRIRVQRPDGSECAPREVGEVFMMPPAGRGSTYRYIGAEPVAAADGWETLGDMGYLDEEGFLYLVERKSDMILVGGANVYPAEIEAALDAHPAVRSSAVIGLPDDDLGSRVHAIVDATAPVGEDELRAHLAAHLVQYKIPRSFEFVHEPLRDDAGKVRRSALREERLSR
jgi:bile acid-coenzyme A ligase